MLRGGIALTEPDHRPELEPPGTRTPVRLPRMLDSFRYRDFRLLWTTSFLSAVARNLQQISLGWLVFDLTGSGVLLGSVLFVYQIPFLTVSLFIGALVDRVDRRKLLAASQFTMAAVAVALAVDIALGWVRPWHLFIFAIVSGVENTLIHIVRQALVPRVVPRESLLNGISLTGVGFTISRIAAPVVGGLLIVSIGVAGNFALQALVLIGVAVSSIPMRVGKAEGANRRSGHGVRTVLQDVGDAGRHILADPPLRLLFGIQFVAMFFILPFTFFLPVWADRVLGSGAGVLGWLYAAGGIGALVGTLLLAQLGRVSRNGRLLLLILIANGLGLMALGGVSGLYPILGILLCLGVVHTIFMVVNTTLVQSTVPDSLQGRVMSIYNLGHGSMAIGILVMGYMVDWGGVQLAVAIIGAAFLVVSMLAAPGLRRIWAL
jgi:MFS family permease